MSVRHTRQGFARGQHDSADRRREGDDDGPDHRPTKSPRGGSSQRLPLLADYPIPCRLCQPDHPCSFHEDDQ